MAQPDLLGAHPAARSALRGDPRHAGRGQVALRPPRPRADVHLRMRADPAGVQPRWLSRFGAHDRRTARADRQWQERHRRCCTGLWRSTARRFLPRPSAAASTTRHGSFPAVIFILATLGTFGIVWLWKRRSLRLAGTAGSGRRPRLSRANQSTGRGPARSHSPRDGVLNDPHRRYLRPHPRQLRLHLLAGAQSLRAGRQDPRRLPRERKEAIYENLRDLNFEFQAGKYPEADYNEQRRALEDEAAQVIAEMESLIARGMKSTRARA